MKYVFFFHYYKQKKCMSVHFRNKCMTAKDVICNVPVTTKWNKTQPMLVMKGKATSVTLENNILIIN